MTGFKAGDKVFYAGDITRPGCNSEYHLVDERIAAKAPGKIPPEDAAAMPLTSITAWEGLFERLGFVPKAGADTILNHKNSLYEELKAAGTDSVDAIFCTTQMEMHWKAMAECIRPQGRIVLIDDPKNPLDITVFKLKSVSISWEFMYTRSMFKTDDMAEQGKVLSIVGKLLDEGALVTTRQKVLTGLIPENIQAMHIKQESGTMMGKQVLVLNKGDRT